MPVKKKKTVRKPTIRQKRLVKKISENIGKKGAPQSLGKMMIEAGYSESQSKSPAPVLSSQTFIDLLDKYGVSDDNLAKSCGYGLNFKPKKDTPAWMMVKHKYIETGLKLRKHLNPMGEEVIDAFKQLVQIRLPPHDPL